MPDGDRHHPALGLKYQKPYLQLCEGVRRPDDLSRDVARRLKRDLELDYPRVDEGLRAVIQRLELITDSLAAMAPDLVDWREMSLEMRRIVSGTSGRKRDDELVVRAAQKLLCDMEAGCAPQNVAVEVRQEFVRGFYASRFGDVVATPGGLPDVPPRVLEERLRALDAHIGPQLDEFGVQLSRAEQGERARLRMLPRRVERIESLNDLESIGMEELHR